MRLYSDRKSPDLSHLHFKKRPLARCIPLNAPLSHSESQAYIYESAWPANHGVLDNYNSLSLPHSLARKLHFPSD